MDGRWPRDALSFSPFSYIIDVAQPLFKLWQSEDSSTIWIHLRPNVVRWPLTAAGNIFNESRKHSPSIFTFGDCCAVPDAQALSCHPGFLISIVVHGHSLSQPTFLFDQVAKGWIAQQTANITELGKLVRESHPCFEKGKPIALENDPP